MKVLFVSRRLHCKNHNTSTGAAWLLACAAVQQHGAAGENTGFIRCQRVVFTQAKQTHRQNKCTRRYPLDCDEIRCGLHGRNRFCRGGVSSGSKKRLVTSLLTEVPLSGLLQTHFKVPRPIDANLTESFGGVCFTSDLQTDAKCSRPLTDVTVFISGWYSAGARVIVIVCSQDSQRGCLAFWLPHNTSKHSTPCFPVKKIL